MKLNNLVYNAFKERLQSDYKVSEHDTINLDSIVRNVILDYVKQNPPEPKVVIEQVVKEVPVEVIKEVIKEVPIEVIKEILVETPRKVVDIEHLKKQIEFEDLEWERKEKARTRQEEETRRELAKTPEGLRLLMDQRFRKIQRELREEFRTPFTN